MQYKYNNNKLNQYMVHKPFVNVASSCEDVSTMVKGTAPPGPAHIIVVMGVLSWSTQLVASTKNYLTSFF